MDGSGELLLGLLGLALVCCGLPLIAVLIILRGTGNRLLPLVALFVRSRIGQEDANIEVRAPRPHIDLRSRAEAAKQEQVPLAGHSPVVPRAPRPPLDEPAARERRHDEDEIFGGMLDADGDGDIDF